jgi:pimeloyl-ACP methyl ester carboxylesterase
MQTPHLARQSLNEGQSFPESQQDLRGETTVTTANEHTAGKTSGYASINGLNMYYEIHGESNPGVPLVLLHGGMSATGTSFGLLLPGLAKNRRVISIEQQAHGRTADIDRPMSIPQMAGDTAAVLRHLNVKQADLLGYSMGAGIALQVAIDHPEMVRKLVFISLYYKEAGAQPGQNEDMAGLKPEHLHGTPFHDEYMSIAPRPEDFPALIERIKQMNADVQDWPTEALRAIKSHVLNIIADADIVQAEHAVEIFRLFGGGAPDYTNTPRSQLAIIPGANHITVVHHPELLVPIIESFLGSPTTEAA